MYTYITRQLNHLVIKIILVCITVLEVMFYHNECLMEAKDICSRASGNLKTYLISSPYFVIFFEPLCFVL